MAKQKMSSLLDSSVVQTTLIDSFQRNITHFFPEGSPSPEIEKLWCEEALEMCANNGDIVRNAWEAAISLGSRPLHDQCQKTSKKQVAGLSLDALLKSGGGLSLPITWERVGETPEADQYQILQKVEYIADIAYEWSNFQTVLLRGLIRDPENFIELHRKWFGLARDSQEFHPIELGLAENLVSASLDPQLQKNIDMRQRIISLVHGIWLDWMIRGDGSFGYHDQESASLVLSALKEWYSKDRDILVTLDPYARWYRLWIAQKPVKDILVEVESAFPSFLDAIHDLSHRLPGDLSSHEKDSLCMFYGILSAVRVTLFPWDKISGTSRENLRQLYSQLSNEDDEIRSIALDASMILS